MTAGSGTRISARVGQGHQGCASSGCQPPRKERLPAPNCLGHSLPFLPSCSLCSFPRMVSIHAGHTGSTPCPALGKCQTTVSPEGGDQGTHRPVKTGGHRGGHLQRPQPSQRIPYHLLPSSLVLTGKMMLSVHLPGLYPQGPGWPPSLQATCPQ